MTNRFETLRSQLAGPPTPATDLQPEPGPAGKEFVQADSQRLMVADTTRLTRWWLTVPMAFAMLVFPVGFVHDWIHGYYQARESWPTYQEDILSSFGKTYLQNILDTGMPTTLDYTYPDGQVSFGEYARYRWIDQPGGWQHEALGVGMSVVFLIAAGFGFGLGFGGRRRQRLVFDRDRQAIYTWVLGKACAVPWESASVAMRPTGVSWLLKRDNHDGQPPEQVPIPVYLGASALSPALDEWKQTHCGRVAAFMAEGMSAIEGAPFSRKDPFTLRVDPAPADGLEQVDRLLAKLRAAVPPED